MTALRLGSLFDGIGVFPLAAVRCGIEPIWASEIEKAPISITKRHFPDMAHLGDVTKLDGRDLPPVHIDQLTYDPLIIQKEYAMRLGSLYVGSLEQQTIYDASGTKVSIADKRVLLRCTYDNMIAGIRLLSKQGANLVETEHDVERIESWYRLGLTRRSIQEVELSELMSAQNHLDMEDKIFLKSKHKGFIKLTLLSSLSNAL